MSDQITLREYRSSDLEALFRLDEICFDAAFRFDREAMQYFAGRSGAISLVAESEGGQIAGFVIVHLERIAGERRGYIVTLDVAVEFRNRGLGRALVQEAERRVTASGARKMELHVFEGNPEAIFFYERLKYQRVAERPHFYGDGLHAFLYRKLLQAI
jgi:ribosomal-protein-alanine N-acetyltransferase